MKANPSTPQTPRNWFYALRSQESWLILKRNSQVLILLYVIAQRARYKSGINPDGLELGEAMLGDHAAYGMTEQQYRTAKRHAQKWGLARFRSTSRGTIGKLTGAAIFDVRFIPDNDRERRPETEGQRPANVPPTTNVQPVDRISRVSTIDRLNDATAAASGESVAPVVGGGLGDLSSERFGEEGARQKVTPGRGTFGMGDLPPPPPRSKASRKREEFLLGQIRKLCGDDEMNRCGGNWRLLIRAWPEIIAAVIADMNAQVQEGVVYDNRGAYRGCYERFCNLL